MAKSTSDIAAKVAAPERHFLDLKDHTPETLRGMLDLARSIKAGRTGLSKGALDAEPGLAGRTLAMVFERPSTRTRVSFEMAMRQAGGSSLLLGDSQMGRGETPQDTARVLSRMVDMVMIRARKHAMLLEFASACDVPVINALTDRSHPCQLMADILTIEERLGSVAGKKIAWLGDGNNVATSLIEAAVKFDFEVVLATPEGFEPDAGVLAWAQAQGGTISQTRSAAEAVKGADVVMTDTWVSMGDEGEDARRAAMTPYRVDEALMAQASSTALFMHCLPAHRGDEVTDAVIDGPQSAVWQTAENRLHAQKAIMAWLCR